MDYEFTYYPPGDEHRHFMDNKPKWSIKRYFHIGPLSPTDWMEWWIFGAPIQIIGHGPFAGHRWTVEWTERRRQKMWDQSTVVRTHDMCDDCMVELRRLRSALEDACDHDYPGREDVERVRSGRRRRT